MAFIKAAESGKSVRRIMDYVDRKAEIESGLNVSDDKETAILEMLQTKEMYDKTEGRQYKHYIQSFSPLDTGKLTPEKAHELGREWAAKHFPGFEVYIGTHTDKAHIHNHFVINSVSFEDGHKIQISSQDLQIMKQHSNELCQREGLIVPTKDPARGEVRTYNMRKYQLMQRVAEGQNVKSFVLDTAFAVEKASRGASSREDFITAMQRQGYTTKWHDNIKHVTFEDMEGNKVRLSNLQKTFNNDRFTKEGLNHEFETVRNRIRANENDSSREISRAEHPKPVRVREQPIEGKSDRVRTAVSGVEEGASRYSFTANREREQHEREFREQAARAERERAAAQKQQRPAEQQHQREHGERGYDIER